MFFIIFIIVDLIFIPVNPLIFIGVFFSGIFILVLLFELKSREYSPLEEAENNRVKETVRPPPPGYDNGGRVEGQVSDVNFQVKELLSRIDLLKSELTSLKQQFSERERIITDLKNKLEKFSEPGFKINSDIEADYYRELLEALELKYASGELTSEEYNSLKSKYESRLKKFLT